MSTLHVENLKGLSSGSNANKIIVPSGQTLHAAGHVIQTISGTYDTLTSTTSKIPAVAISLNITPVSTSSKILVLMQTFAWHNNYYTGYLGIFRGSIDITKGTDTSAVDNNWSSGNYQGGIGVRTTESYSLQTQDNDGSATNWAPFPFSHTILDSPSSTSQQTYALKFWTNDSGTGSYNPLYINRANNVSNSPRPISTLTLQEIAQ
jgi:hypothetical protein